MAQLSLSRSPTAKFADHFIRCGVTGKISVQSFSSQHPAQHLKSRIKARSKFDNQILYCTITPKTGAKHKQVYSSCALYVRSMYWGKFSLKIWGAALPLVKYPIGYKNKQKNNEGADMKKVRIHFKMTDEDKSILEEKMKRWGFDNMSEFLRCLIRSDDSLYLPTRTQLTYEINKIGVNLNQITRHLNERNPIHVLLLNDAAKIKSDLTSILKSFDESIKAEKKLPR
ncbi:plasmid mobilization protein [Burkholderia glumae]|uniref:plasmid mobilization protein n=1 Tax=Burkholderia glumae TaxID=337 RepID=UPI002151C156|nr:plasmid mobilization relaxosome protein MobC [Burkholderia glumae]